MLIFYDPGKSPKFLKIPEFRDEVEEFRRFLIIGLSDPRSNMAPWSIGPAVYQSLSLNDPRSIGSFSIIGLTCHRNPNITKKIGRNSHWRKLSMIMVLRALHVTLPQTRILFIFLVYIFIHYNLANKIPFGVEIFTDDSPYRNK